MAEWVPDDQSLFCTLELGHAGDHAWQSGWMEAPHETEHRDERENLLRDGGNLLGLHLRTRVARPEPSERAAALPAMPPQPIRKKEKEGGHVIRRFFLRALTLAAIPPPGEAKRRNLDALINNYNRLFESVVNVGENTVCYERETWNSIREAFARIVEASDD